MLRVVTAGPLVTVQDGGRPGMLRYGVPASGPMDRKALAIANLALGNPVCAAGIEVSRGGLELVCEADVSVALAGGGFVVRRDAVAFGSWAVLTLRAGQRLRISAGPWGSWTCLAVAGVLEGTEWLGSAATHALSGLGGGSLRAGQCIGVRGARVVAERAIPCPVWARPRAVVHAVPGPQDDGFGAEAMESFFSSTYRVTDAYDRMGMRLAGTRVVPVAGLALASQAILRGSVQVAGDGVPVVLLADHQTTGGYPKIATVLGDDLDGLAQLRSHEAVRFQRIDAGVAVRMARARALGVARYLEALARWRA